MSDVDASSLAGRVALVTGGASGIGLATCRALVREGAVVVSADLGHRPGVPRPESGALAMAVDVRREADVTGAVERVVERFGRIDLLVHCAGILRASGTMPKPVARLSAAEWDEVVDVNLTGTFLCNRAVVPVMMKQRAGQIVNLSSTSGRHGRALDAPYCASKFGVVGLTQSLAEEVRAYGIKVYVILPDAVDTPLWRQNGPIPPPLHALAPERVARLICFLLALPGDTILDNIVISPFHGRRRRERREDEAGEPARRQTPDAEDGDGPARRRARRGS